LVLVLVLVLVKLKLTLYSSTFHAAARLQGDAWFLPPCLYACQTCSWQSAAGWF